MATWQVVYFTINPGFADQYAAYAIDRARASGATEPAITDLRQQMARFKVMLDNPLYSAALTLIEPLPVGLLVTLVSAALLRKK